MSQFCCKFTSVYVCQKPSKYIAVWQSYCKNKRVHFCPTVSISLPARPAYYAQTGTIFNGVTLDAVCLFVCHASVIYNAVAGSLALPRYHWPCRNASCLSNSWASCLTGLRLFLHRPTSSVKLAWFRLQRTVGTGR